MTVAPSQSPGGSEPVPGSRLGRYLVLDRLGAGGMGVVYAAYDPQLDRRVALKLLRASEGGSGESGGGRERLVREAHAMAKLSHPNVVPVFDVGEHEGGLFLAMELVDGVTLDAWQSEPHSWREVLDVYLDAGRGLAAAHAAGIVHRDFKPSNVLLGKDGRARVTDFGLARKSSEAAPAAAHSKVGANSLDTPMTLAGAIMGTPGFMAPEQYLGEISTPASDQFSFCASLYLSLYGELPFAGETLAKLALATQTGAVRPPPSRRVVPPWVRKILLRGLAADPAQRFDSLDVLLATLAADPSVRRRRIAGATAALLLVALAAISVRAVRQRRLSRCIEAGAISSTWNDATRERLRQAFLATHLPFAEKAFDETARRIDHYSARWSETWSGACEALHVRHEEAEPVLALRQACLEGRRDELSALLDVLARAGSEEVTHGVQAADSLPPPSTCADTPRLLERRTPPPAQADQVRKARRELAAVEAMIGAGRYKPARTRADSLESPVAAVGYGPLSAELYRAIGDARGQDGAYAPAVEAYEHSLAQAERAEDAALAADDLVKLVALVGFKLDDDRRAKFLAELARAQIDRLGGSPILTARLTAAEGDVDWEHSRFAEAEVEYRKALSALASSLGTDHPEVANLHYSLAFALMDLGRLEEARSELETSLDIFVRIDGPLHPEVAALHSALGGLAQNLGQLVVAERELEQAKAIYLGSVGEEGPHLVPVLMNLARVALDRGQGQSAYDDLVELRRRAGPVLLARSPQELDLEMQEGFALAELHRFDEAIARHQKVLDAIQQKPPDPTWVPMLMVALSNDERQAGHSRRALDWADKAGASKIDPTAMGPSLRKDIVQARGEALLALGKSNEARAALEKALAAVQANAHGKPSDEADVRFDLAQAEWASGSHDKARVQAVAADAIYRKLADGRGGAIHAWLASHPAPSAHAASSSQAE